MAGVTRIALRRGTADEWFDDNPTLQAGEPGVELDTLQLKIGNGIDPWRDLTYTGDPMLAMELAEALAGTVTTPRAISADVLREAIVQLAGVVSFSNVFMQAIWDGEGVHPLRPADIPETYFVIWRQPTAPLVGDEFAHDGDEWEVTEGVG